MKDITLSEDAQEQLTILVRNKNGGLPWEFVSAHLGNYDDVIFYFQLKLPGGVVMEAQTHASNRGALYAIKFAYGKFDTTATLKILWAALKTEYEAEEEARRAMNED